MSAADEAGDVFDAALARQEAKPLNGRATPQQVGYFEAGFEAGAVWERSRHSPRVVSTVTDDITEWGDDLNPAETGPSSGRRAMRAALSAALDGEHRG